MCIRDSSITVIITATVIIIIVVAIWTIWIGNWTGCYSDAWNAEISEIVVDTAFYCSWITSNRNNNSSSQYNWIVNDRSHNDIYSWYSSCSSKTTDYSLILVVEERVVVIGDGEGNGSCDESWIDAVGSSQVESSNATETCGGWIDAGCAGGGASQTVDSLTADTIDDSWGDGTGGVGGGLFFNITWSTFEADGCAGAL